jgi:hypothetical protein
MIDHMGSGVGIADQRSQNVSITTVRRLRLPVQFYLKAILRTKTAQLWRFCRRCYNFSVLYFRRLFEGLQLLTVHCVVLKFRIQLPARCIVLNQRCPNGARDLIRFFLSDLSQRKKKPLTIEPKIIPCRRTRWPAPWIFETEAMRRPFAASQMSRCVSTGLHNP